MAYIAWLFWETSQEVCSWLLTASSLEINRAKQQSRTLFMEALRFLVPFFYVLI